MQVGFAKDGPEGVAQVECREEDEDGAAHEEDGGHDLGEEEAHGGDLCAVDRGVDFAHRGAALVVDVVADAFGDPEGDGREEANHEANKGFFCRREGEEPKIGFAGWHLVHDRGEGDEGQRDDKGSAHDAGYHGVGQRRADGKGAANAGSC